MNVRPCFAPCRRAPQRMAAAACLALSGALGGCGTPSLHQPAVDTPWSSATAPSPSPWCRQAQGLRQLAPGDNCRLVIQAAAWLNATGVQVCPQQTYELAISSDQYWVDADRRSHPLHGDPGSGFMNLFAHAKRVPGVPWFLLVAGVRTPGSADSEDPVLQALAPLPATEAKDRALFAGRTRGELVLAANDAQVPWVHDWLYGNNHGRILATLTLQAGSPRCP